MKATLISKENNEAKFSIEFTAEEFENAIIDVYKQNKDQFEVDGFRKGKVPRSIVEKHYGEDIFFQDAINALLMENYEKTLSELELDVIDSPKLGVEDGLEKGKGFTLTCEVPLYPVVEVKDYKGVEVEEVIPEVKAEEVDTEIENMRKRNARIEIADHAVEDGNIVILDYAGFHGEEQFPGGTAERQELQVGSNMFIPGFEEQLIGAKPGEDVDVTVTFPADYPEESLAGEDTVFHCHIHEVKEEILPELDDEFAKDVSEFDTLAELREDTEKKMFEYAEQQCKNMARDNALEQVYNANDCDVPTAMTEEEIDRLIQQFNQELGYQGLTLPDYLKFLGQEMKDFREQLREEAERKVRMRIFLTSIAAQEETEATDEDLEAEMDKLANVYSMDADQVREMIGEENMFYVKKDIILKKVMDMIYDEAKVTKITREDKEKELADEVAQQAKDAAAEDAE